ncbi:MAG: ABC transporter permease subunit [Xenophilus sp.]
MGPHLRHRDKLLGVAGTVLFALAWEAIGTLRLLGMGWPPLSQVLGLIADPNRSALFWRALASSLHALAVGYCAGVAGGLLLAAATHLLPALRPGVDRASALVNAIPSIALAPLFLLFLGNGATPAAMAALTTFFVVYVAATSGLAAASPMLRDLIQVLGGSRVTRFLRIDLPSALPQIVSGMRLAAPSALIGVIVGEWFGAPRGLGVLVINAMQNFQIPLLWAAVLLAVVTSLLFFVLLGAVQNAVRRRFS